MYAVFTWHFAFLMVNVRYIYIIISYVVPLSVSRSPGVELRKVKGVVPASLASRVIRRVRHGVSVLTQQARPRGQIFELQGVAFPKFFAPKQDWFL